MNISNFTLLLYFLITASLYEGELVDLHLFPLEDCLTFHFHMLS